MSIVHAALNPALRHERCATRATRSAHQRSRHLVRTLILAVSVLGIPVFAADPPGYPEQITAYDPREVAMLPRYCIYTQGFRDAVPGGNNQAEIKHWYHVMGPTYHTMHHYCAGLMKTNRANLARTRTYQQFYLQDAIGEFDYVLQRAPADFPLLPEILTKKGENLIRLGRAALAVKELRDAVRIKPDYWPPYAALSDLYKQNGDVQGARRVLEEGLALSPEAKGLKNRLAELDKPKGPRKHED